MADDRERLVNLLLLVMDKTNEWYRPIAARKLDEFDRAQQAGEPAGEALRDRSAEEEAAKLLSRVSSYIVKADQYWSSNGRQGDSQDARDLPGMALEAVLGIPDELRLVIGAWVADAYCVPEADDRAIADLWIDDVTRTAWRVLVDQGAFPAQYADLRRRAAGDE